MPNLICVICKLGPGYDNRAETIVGGHAVCGRHITYIRKDDALVAAVDRAYQEEKH